MPPLEAALGAHGLAAWGAHGFAAGALVTQGFLVAQGLAGALAAQGLAGAHGFFAFGAQGFDTTQGFAAGEEAVPKI